ncbi:hypothetical protein T02_8911 [Trichinella nativa]|uniref:Uncharacterized protein n=1 Tax=Trichinella nativa TaxID=6335 RepID=A0A0V1KKP3_9BILA|nr:hypothetical protein T06_6614 [Trichinella sp. T6]KRZ47751.1 hypothetical protein T02_8911 [Trichinella nativa]
MTPPQCTHSFQTLPLVGSVALLFLYESDLITRYTSRRQLQGPLRRNERSSERDPPEAFGTGRDRYSPSGGRVRTD